MNLNKLPWIVILALLVLVAWLSQRPYLQENDLLLLPDNDEDRVFLSWGPNSAKKRRFEDSMRDAVRKGLPKWDRLRRRVLQEEFNFLGPGGDLDNEVRQASDCRLTIDKRIPQDGDESRMDDALLDVSYVRIDRIEYCVYGATLYDTTRIRTVDGRDEYAPWVHPFTVEESQEAGKETEIKTSFRIQVIKQIYD